MYFLYYTNFFFVFVVIVAGKKGMYIIETNPGLKMKKIYPMKYSTTLKNLKFEPVSST